MKRFKLRDAKFADFFDDVAPSFAKSTAKKRPGPKPVAQPGATKGQKEVDLTDEDEAIRRAKKEMRNKKRREKLGKKKKQEEIDREGIFFKEFSLVCHCT